MTPCGLPGNSFKQGQQSCSVVDEDIVVDAKWKELKPGETSAGEFAPLGRHL